MQLTNMTGKVVTAVTSAGLSLLGKQARLVLQSSQFLDVSAASAPIALVNSGAQFQTLHVEIRVTGQGGPCHSPFISSNGTGGLALRDLQINDACAASSAASTDQMPHIIGAIVCAQEIYKDGITGEQVPICGPATVCTDAPVLEGSSATGPQCACASGALRQFATVSFEDAPYLAGDHCECDAGFLPADGGGPCVACPVGTYKSDIGSGACLPCDQHRTTLEVGTTSPTNCVCKEQFVLNSDGECTPCLSITDGAICEAPNMTVRTLHLKPQYWRISSTSLDVRKCRGDSSTPCAGGVAASCAEHHGGPKCEVCTTEMYYFDKEVAVCTRCPDGATPLIISVVGLFIIICALSLLRFLFTTASVHFKRVGAAARIITSAVVRIGPSKVKLAATQASHSGQANAKTPGTIGAAPKALRRL